MIPGSACFILIDWFPFLNGPFAQSQRQSAGFLVRNTQCTSPRIPCAAGSWSHRYLFERNGIMSKLRRGRRRYYDIFASFYDSFIKLHARKDGDDTRHFLVEAAHLRKKSPRFILDVCCGTGSVTQALARKNPDALLVGYDFSRGMLRKAQEKNAAGRVVFVEGDASTMPFSNDSFDIVTCSHALYELRGSSRDMALLEMKRILNPSGCVLLMEHEVPANSLTRFLFYLRLLCMGSKDAREFMDKETKRLKKIFPQVDIRHSPSGKSRLTVCRELET